MPDLTEAEISLAKRHPIEFVTYGGCSIDALNEAKKYYGGDQLTKEMVMRLDMLIGMRF